MTTADARPAPRCHQFELREDGEVEGKAYIWPIKRNATIVIAMYHDGEIAAYIENGEGHD